MIEKWKIQHLIDKVILIVEDVSANYKYLEIILNKMGFNTLWAPNGKEAVDICTGDEEVDLILMDIKLPDMNGFTATRLIKKIRPEIPVVAQTVLSKDEIAKRDNFEVFDAYIRKPFTSGEIIKILSANLKNV